jgi:hypothetical protein
MARLRESGFLAHRSPAGLTKKLDTYDNFDCQIPPQNGVGMTRGGTRNPPR